MQRDLSPGLQLLWAGVGSDWAPEGPDSKATSSATRTSLPPAFGSGPPAAGGSTSRLQVLTSLKHGLQHPWPVLREAGKMESFLETRGSTACDG